MYFTVICFRLCFAATAHSFQGQTIVKPNKLVADIKSVFEPAQAYVILSRVQCIDQLFILKEVPASKFYTSEKALKELMKLEENSINQNPPPWEQHIKNSVKISLLNCRDIMTKYLDIKEDFLLKKSDIIFLNETHLNDEDENKEILQLPGYKLKLNSAGIGKGIASYFKEEKFTYDQKETMQKAQIMKLTSESLDVINIYRSHDAKNCDDECLIQEIQKIINKEKLTLICGDMNLCYIQKRQSILFAYIEKLGFNQLVHEATHIKGGHIDVLFSNHTAFQSEIDIAIYSTYYTCRDHDALLITVTPKENKLQENKYMRRSDRILQQRKRKGSQEEQQKSKRQRLSNE